MKSVTVFEIKESLKKFCDEILPKSEFNQISPQFEINFGDLRCISHAVAKFYFLNRNKI